MRFITESFHFFLFVYFAVFFLICLFYYVFLEFLEKYYYKTFYAG